MSYPVTIIGRFEFNSPEDAQSALGPPVPRMKILQVFKKPFTGPRFQIDFSFSSFCPTIAFFSVENLPWHKCFCVSVFSTIVFQ